MRVDWKLVFHSSEPRMQAVRVRRVLASGIGPPNHPSAAISSALIDI